MCCTPCGCNIHFLAPQPAKTKLVENANMAREQTQSHSFKSGPRNKNNPSLLTWIYFFAFWGAVNHTAFGFLESDDGRITCWNCDRCLWQMKGAISGAVVAELSVETSTQCEVETKKARMPKLPTSQVPSYGTQASCWSWRPCVASLVMQHAVLGTTTR